MTANASLKDIERHGLGHGFEQPSRDSQAVFRTVMTAMARPGRILALTPFVDPPKPLLATTAAVVLALADFETAIWLDAPLATIESVQNYLRFHSGSRLVEDPRDAAFAVVSRPTAMPRLTVFNQGSPQFPDRSTTVIVEVSSLYPEGWTLQGPGIDNEIGFSAAPLPAEFIGQVRANRDQFPLGVDLIFVTATEIAALPRSARLREG